MLWQVERERRRDENEGDEARRRRKLVLSARAQERIGDALPAVGEHYWGAKASVKGITGRH